MSSATLNSYVVRLHRSRAIEAACLVLCVASRASAAPICTTPEQARQPDLASLESVPLFEELSQKVWEVNVRVRTGFRNEVALNAIIGAALNDRDEPYAVAGPALSLRGLWDGGSTSDDFRVLSRRLGRLAAIDEKRLDATVTREAAATKQALLSLCDKIRSINRELSSYGESTEGGYPEPLEPFNCTAEPNDQGYRPGAQSEQGEAQAVAQRIAYLRSVLCELHEDWSTRAANAVFLDHLRKESDKLFEEAGKLLAAVDESRSGFIFFLEGHVGYAFQLSNQGITSELGGLMVGVGGGLDTPLGGISIGILAVTPFDPGLYLALSASAFD